jgi:hypothetical protein
MNELKVLLSPLPSAIEIASKIIGRHSYGGDLKNFW